MQIGADHMDVKIDPVVNAMAMLLSGIIGHTPRFKESTGPDFESETVLAIILSCGWQPYTCLYWNDSNTSDEALLSACALHPQ